MRSSRVVSRGSSGEVGFNLGQFHSPSSIFRFGGLIEWNLDPDRKHFIPLSSSYSELYNLQTFFTGFPPSLAGTRGNRTVPTTSLSKPSPIPALPPNEDGSDFHADTVLQEIAEAGSKWKKEHLRKEDMEVSRFHFSSLPIGTNVSENLIHSVTCID